MSGNKNNKKEKFEERILHELNKALRSEFSDSRLQFVSFTKVELNSDLSEANVYWDTFDASKRGDIKKAIDGIGSKLRAVLSTKLNVRHTPNLVLQYDSQYESQKSIEDILSSEVKNGKPYSD
ncbi:MAG: 30S ribosome-binding factor RbfA [Bacteriovoracaceae bacterium]|nr:30S ribosome-binding factor RbfA [Bacteriovoracaceae bacterium]